MYVCEDDIDWLSYFGYSVSYLLTCPLSQVHNHDGLIVDL